MDKLNEWQAIWPEVLKKARGVSAHTYGVLLDSPLVGADDTSITLAPRYEYHSAILSQPEILGIVVEAIKGVNNNRCPTLKLRTPPAHEVSAPASFPDFDDDGGADTEQVGNPVLSEDGLTLRFGGWISEQALAVLSVDKGTGSYIPLQKVDIHLVRPLPHTEDAVNIVGVDGCGVWYSDGDGDPDVDFAYRRILIPWHMIATIFTYIAT